MNAIGGQTSARRGRWTGVERRAQVAAVTLDVIAREGVHGASLARIAEVAGITAPSLYNHFSGRTEILEAASDLLLERVLAWIDSSTNPNMLERLREIGGSVHESPYRRRPGMGHHSAVRADDRRAGRGPDRAHGQEPVDGPAEVRRHRRGGQAAGHHPSRCRSQSRRLESDGPRVDQGLRRCFRASISSSPTAPPTRSWRTCSTRSQSGSRVQSWGCVSRQAANSPW